MWKFGQNHLTKFSLNQFRRRDEFSSTCNLFEPKSLYVSMWYTNRPKPVQTSLNLIFCYIKRVHHMNFLEGLCLELRNISFNYLRKLETHWNYLKRGKNWTQRGTDLWIDQVHDKMTFDWRLRLAKSCHIDLLLATTNCTVLKYNKLEIDY